MTSTLRENRRRTRFVFSPHIGGWGHRVRSDTIARAIARRRPESDVRMLVRPDDPTPPNVWTEFPVARSGLARSWAIATADILVQDGAWKYDFRVRLQQIRGGRYVVIGQPYRIDMLVEAARRVLSAAEAIIIPWPKRLFEPHGMLANFTIKLVNANPVLNVAPSRSAPLDQQLIYLAVSRGAPRVLGTVRAGIQRVMRDHRDGRIENAGGLGQFLPRDEHSRLFSSSMLVISQAPTAVFEAMGLGIPALMIPLTGNQEHEKLAKDLNSNGAGLAIPESELTEKTVAAAVESLLFDESLRGRIIARARALVPESGLEEIVSVILGRGHGEV